MKKVPSIFVAASFTLAIALTPSCTNGGGSGGDDSSSSGGGRSSSSENALDQVILSSSSEKPSYYSSSSETVSISSSSEPSSSKPNSSSSAATQPNTSNGSSSGSGSGSDSGTAKSSSSIVLSSSSKTPFDDIKFWVGEGTNKAMLVIQWNDGKNPDALVWGYKWNGTKKGYDMINDIAKVDKRLFLLTYDEIMLGRAIAGIGYNFSGEAKVSNGESCEPLVDGSIETDGYDFDSWELCGDADARWRVGWYDGYWSYWLWETDAYKNNYPGTNKYYYSQRGASSRTLTDGARDVWYWSDGFSLGGSDISDNSLLFDFVPASK